MIKQCREFIEKYKFDVLLAFILSLLAYGFMFFNSTVSIDEETWLLNTQLPIGWIDQGRISIYLFDLLFSNQGEPIAFLWDFLAVTTWFCAGLVFLMIIKGELEKTNRFSQVFFLVYFATLPFVSGQMMSYSMSAWPVATGILATAFAVNYTLKWVAGKGRKDMVLAGLLLMYGVSIYQAILGLYISAVVIICFLRGLAKNDWSWELIWKSALTAVVSSGIFMALSMLCTSLFHSNNQAYLTDNFIGWIEDSSPLHALFMTIANVARVSFGITIDSVTIYGGVVICVATMLFILYAVYVFIKADQKGQRLKILLFSIGIVLAPFTIYLFLGTYKTQGRMLLGLCLTGAFQYLLLLNYMMKKKNLRYVAIVAAVYLLFLNIGNVNRIYYYDYVRYNHDQVIANEIMYEIQKKGYDYQHKPIVFIGMLEPEVGLTVRNDTLGTRGSYFRWDDGNIGRINRFIMTQGYAVVYPTKDQIQSAVSEIDKLPDWPSEDSVTQTDEAIVVKLSSPTDKWYQINGVTK